MSRKIELIWNERASPRRARRGAGRAGMSRPSKKIRPSSESIPPVNWPTSVVLPAPLGPMSARISPDLISRLTLSVAISPPNRFTSLCVQSRESATATHLWPQARDLKRAHHAFLREQYDQNEDRAQDHLPMPAEGREQFFEQEQEGRAQN